MTKDGKMAERAGITEEIDRQRLFALHPLSLRQREFRREGNCFVDRLLRASFFKGVLEITSKCL